MTSEGLDRNMCNRCGASYDSETTLRQHRLAAHREVPSERGVTLSSAKEGTESGGLSQQSE
jgi:hypothetical protein